MQNPPLNLGMTYLHMWLFVQLPFTGDLSKRGPLRIFFFKNLIASLWALNEIWIKY